MNAGKALRALHYARHPLLLRDRAEEKDSLKHATRLQDYEPLSKSLEEFVRGLTTQEVNAKLVERLKSSSFCAHIERSYMESLGKSCGPMRGDSAILLQIIVNLMQPDIVVETGVANGFSTAFILNGLHENNKGTLYSCDIPPRRGITVPVGKTLGWVIPNELRSRWVLNVGESKKVLPKLMRKLGVIDIFLHDSKHLYKTMTFEFETVWPFLKKGGILLSDDVKGNDAFLDFADSLKAQPLIFEGVGGLRK